VTAPRHIRIPRDVLRERPLTPVEVGGRRLVVAIRDGVVFALADRCPHRGAALSSGGEVVTPFVQEDGRLTPGAPDSHVRCPWHKWDFDLSSGRCASDDRLRVRTYQAWLEDDEVVIRLDSRAPHEEASA
jgi:nitrite reductase (NADH) small subunit